MSEKTIAEEKRDEGTTTAETTAEAETSTAQTESDGKDKDATASAQEESNASEANDVEEQEGSSEREAPQKESHSGDSADASLKMQLVRLQADFQNYRKRVERDKEVTVRYANEKLLTQLLEVVDNFERALASEKEHDQFYQGMELIHQQFVTLLTNNGLEELDSNGAVFDPNLHQAVMAEESAEVESGHVTATLQKGYRLNGKVIRPAMVKVAK